jgi:hypothetical protein
MDHIWQPKYQGQDPITFQTLKETCSRIRGMLTTFIIFTFSRKMLKNKVS